MDNSVLHKISVISVSVWADNEIYIYKSMVGLAHSGFPCALCFIFDIEKIIECAYPRKKEREKNGEW